MDFIYLKTKQFNHRNELIDVIVFLITYFVLKYHILTHIKVKNNKMLLYNLRN